MEADEAFGGAVAADGEGEQEGGGGQQGEEEEDDARAEGVSEGKLGDGGGLSHVSRAAWATRRSMSWRSL